MKFYIQSVVGLFLLLGTSLFAAEDTVVITNAPALSLNQIVAEVLSNNPSLKSARAKWEAMKERIPQARAWEDLRVGVDATAGRFVEVADNSFTDYKYSAEQTIPLSGKKRWEGRAAEAEAAGAWGDFRRRQLDLTARARMAYYSLVNAREQLGVNRRSSDLLKQMVEITRARYEVGRRPQSDVLSAETELGKLDEARFDFERQISDAQSQLNVLMHRPAQAPLADPAPVAFNPTELSLHAVHELARAHRPELFIAQKKIQAADYQVEIAKRGWIPEPTFRVEASQYNQASQAISEVVAGISFNLPWFNRAKYSAGVRESRKLVESAEEEMAGLESETLGLVRDHLKKVETFHHHTELFRDKIIPLARQNVTATRLSYETDKAEFLNLIEAQRTLQDAESMYWGHLTDYLSALAELEAMVGADPIEAGSPNAQPHKEHHE